MSTTPSLPDYPAQELGTPPPFSPPAPAMDPAAAMAATGVAAAADRAVAQAAQPKPTGPVSVSSLAGLTSTIAVPIGDSVLEVTYRVAENTPELADRLEAADKAGDGEAQLELVFTFLERAVASWELYDDDGNRLPCTRDVFHGRHPSGAPALPNVLLRAVFMGILSDDGGVGPKAPRR